MIGNRRVTEADFLDCQVRMIISRGLPLSFFEDIEVQRAFFCLTSWDGVSFSNPKSIRSRIFEMKDEARNEIRENFQLFENSGQGIGLQVDGWSTKIGRTGYFAIIAHWISTDMRWREELLAFSPTEARHKGRDLAGFVLDAVQYFDITRRIRSITSDNASANGTMIAELNEMLEDSELGGSRKVVHVPCLSHVIQLAQGELLKGLRVFATNSEIIRDWDQKDFEKENIAIKANGEIPVTLWKVSHLC